MEARSLPELVWSSDYVLGEAFPLIYCSSMNLLGIVPLKEVQPVSIQTMTQKI